MTSARSRRPRSRGAARHSAACAAIFAAGALLAGCYALRGSDGGGQTTLDTAAGPAALRAGADPATRAVNPADIALPAGYRIEPVATGLIFPTGVAFDAAGVPHIIEAGYSYGEVWATPRLLRLEHDGSTTEIARGDNPPWNGVTFHDSAFYIAEGGHRDGGRILRITPGEAAAGAEATVDVLIENLPSLGDHHTNGPAFGPDGALYFGQGAATNSAVVGWDSADFGWLKRNPNFHDIPARDITLAGRNFDTQNALGGGGEMTTGAFLPYGAPSQPGQVIRGELPCTGAIMRLTGPALRDLELVAWGMRNPFGLAFAPDGTLHVSDNSYDDRGSRPVWGTGDLVWAIDTGAEPLWHGWPDFHGDRPLTADRYAPPGGKAPGFLLESHPNEPPAPVARLGVHASANGVDFSTSANFGHEGELFIAQFGDMAPPVGKTLAPVGFKVVRLNVETGVVEEFAVNAAGYGPASKVGGGGLERPVAVRFSPDGDALYIVDFGILLSSQQGHAPQPQTGVLWRITRDGDE